MGKKLSKAGKGTYAAYRNKNVYAKNKLRKLERHLKLYPDDKTAQACLDLGLQNGFPYKRKTPNTPFWSHTDKHNAELWASIGHHGKKYLDYLKKMKKNTTSQVAVKTKEVNVQ